MGAEREGEVSGVESVSATRAAEVAERDAACVGRERGECDVEDDGGDENVFGEPIPFSKNSTWILNSSTLSPFFLVTLLYLHI